MSQKVEDYFSTLTPRRLASDAFETTRKEFIDHFYQDGRNVRNLAIRRLAELIAAEETRQGFIAKLQKSIINKRNYDKKPKRKIEEEVLCDHRHPALPQTLPLQSDSLLPPADDRQSLPPTPPLLDSLPRDLNDPCPTAEPPPADDYITLTVKDGITASKLFLLDDHPALRLIPTPTRQDTFKVVPDTDAQGKCQLAIVQGFHF